MGGGRVKDVRGGRREGEGGRVKDVRGGRKDKREREM